MPLTSIETNYEHIFLDENGIPIIAGTNMKVIELVLGKIAHGWSPEELHFQYPHLSLGQIHSALAYYWDNKDSLDQDIERRLEKVKDFQKSSAATPLLSRLKSKKLI